MKTSTKAFLYLVGGTIAAVAGAGSVAGTVALRSGTGFGAKIMASAVFVAGRKPEDVIAAGDVDLVTRFHAKFDVDQQAKSVTCSIGPIASTAVFRPGLGAALLGDLPEGAVRSATAPPPPGKGEDDPRPWPAGDAVPEDAAPPDGVDAEALAKALDEAFSEPKDPALRRRTRAVVVVQDGRILAERYAKGFSRHTPQAGWSMTKSVLAALYGVAVEDGRLRPEEKAGVPLWTKKPGDPRAAITVDQLLRMSSGLTFDEGYGNPFADVVYMLFTANGAPEFAADKPPAAKPDERWQYSSGTSNILSGILRRKIGDDGAYLAYPRRALFDRIGMRHAVMETDPSGNFVASSFCWASARDWARFGLLFLNDGVWGEERILPEGWVDYCRKPTPKAPNWRYGAHFWLNAGTGEEGKDRPYPKLPKDLYVASGFQGQSVSIVPSRRLVVVRLGMTDSDAAFDREAFLAKVLECVAE